MLCTLFWKLTNASDDSNQFVQVFVGPESDPLTDSEVDPQRRRHKLQLMKQHVWNRPYFQGDRLSGRNYISPAGEKTWELTHPQLVNISPQDFRYAAEFLSDGDFGLREAEEEDQISESFAQCMSAWDVADKLGMDDLLNHIVEKIRAMRGMWDLWDVMEFACLIDENEISLNAHDELKGEFCEYIAEVFYVYLEDEDLSGSFLTRLKEHPGLEQGILVKRTEILEARSQLR